MTLTKIGSSAIRFANKNVLLQRLAIRKTKPDTRCKASRRMSTTNKFTDDTDEPIKFSTSEAATWKAEFSRTGRKIPDDSPWYQSHVVAASTAIFLIYFCILREENDIDEKLTRNLTDHFEGEQKENLEATFKLPDDYAKKLPVEK